VRLPWVSPSQAKRRGTSPWGGRARCCGPRPRPASSPGRTPGRRVTRACGAGTKGSHGRLSRIRAAHQSGPPGARRRRRVHRAAGESAPALSRRPRTPGRPARLVSGERELTPGARGCRPVPPATWDDRFVGYGARGRREALRQLNDLRRRLAAAQGGLAGAQATVKRAEAAFDAASDRFAEAERALDAARAERAQARRDRYAAQQAHDRASTAVERLQRRVRELSDRLGGMPLITRKPGHGPHITTVTSPASPGTSSPSFVHMF
jgi:hypothetical protein